MLRKLFYFLPSKWRYVVRRISYLPIDLFQSNKELRPPLGMIYTGGGNFIKDGLFWKDFFINQGLKATDAFLDIGSGIGRIAIGLKEYLKGRYEGFEAMPQGVKWCEENIKPKYLNFNFKYVDIFNDLYNYKGLEASKYIFEYEDVSFEFACAISVFTHMVDDEVENYLKQTSRVLKKGGIFVATFFINHDKESETKDFSFPYEYDNYFLMDDKVRSANVCFKRAYLMAKISEAGFLVHQEIKGFWSDGNMEHPINFQDILVLKKNR